MRPSARDASRLRASDLAALASLGIRMRRLRAALSALGICIGIAAIVGVLGITQSSESDLVAQIDRLGTNLLTVQNGRGFNGGEGTLPLTAPAMIGHMPGVEHVSATALLSPPVYRTDQVPAFKTGGIGVRAADNSLLAALDGSVLHGTYLNSATGQYPAAVLGFGAAQYLGIDRLDTPARVWIAGRWFVVIGILNRVALAPEIDQSVLVGWPEAESQLGFDGYPTRIYIRAATDQVVAVDNLLAATASPESPEQVAVSRPSDALAARIAVVSSSTTLVLGLGAIALLVGGVGIRPGATLRDRAAARAGRDTRTHRRPVPGRIAVALNPWGSRGRDRWARGGGRLRHAAGLVDPGSAARDLDRPRGHAVHRRRGRFVPGAARRAPFAD